MTPPSPSTGGANTAFGRAVARDLADLGVKHIVFSPGSRSTPLILACEEEPRLQTIPVLDERTAGFVALGLSKRRRLPTALICTSGSAVTHWFPAVVEADHSSTPLLLLSADRPPELQDCAAGQTIDQVDLFGRFGRAFFQAPLPDQDKEALPVLRKMLVEAYRATLGKDPGPVHLNFPFREPLLSQEDDLPTIGPPPLSANLTDLGLPPDADTCGLLEHLGACRRLLVVAGERAPAKTFEKWSGENGPPILCDALSPLRDSTCANRILRFENLLRDDGFRALAEPDAIIQLGPLPTSKTLRAWLEELEVPRAVIEPRDRKVDPLQSPSSSFEVDYPSLSSLNLPPCEPRWTSLWMEAESQVDSKLDDFFERENGWFEGKIAHLLSLHLPAGSQLQVANSMPIRDVEWFWKGSDQGRSLFGNRGVNGIDGTLGTAVGLAHDSSKPTFLLTGELAFLHDSNALLVAPKLHGSLTVFLVDNQGGGIFENLPVAGLPAFEKCFATPQQCNFRMLCEAHQIEFITPADWPALVALMAEPSPAGIRVIEIKTDRKRDRTIRRELLELGPGA